MNGEVHIFAPRPAVWFPQWAEVLAQVRLPALVRQQYRMAIVEYLRICKQRRQRATVDSARQFMGEMVNESVVAIDTLAFTSSSLPDSSTPAASFPSATAARFISMS